MNPTSKKFISLFLVFSLMMLPASLYAKKRGAKLIITKKDGQLIKGELIAVKPNSLLLLDTEGKDVSVGIADIEVIRFVKKLKTGRTEALIGLLIGAGGGVILGIVLTEPEYIPSWDITRDLTLINALILGLSFGFLGGILGYIFGQSEEKTYKKIRIEGMTDLEIQETMDKLRKKARIRNYK
jgi:small nuclear ribonucleoprotein (snRNP)-like protein